MSTYKLKIRGRRSCRTHALRLRRRIINLGLLQRMAMGGAEPIVSAEQLGNVRHFALFVETELELLG